MGGRVGRDEQAAGGEATFAQRGGNVEIRFVRRGKPGIERVEGGRV